MIRVILLGLLSFALVASGTAQQPDKDDPEPVRLKKKVRPDDKSAPKGDEKPAAKDEKPGTKPGLKKEEPKDEPEGDPEAKAREILNRIAKNIESAQDRLKKKDTGDSTQQIQRDIVKDIDELIEQAKNPPPDKGDGQANQGNPGGGGGKGGKSSRSSRSARSQPGPGGRQQGQGNSSAKANGNEKGGQQNGQPKNQGGQGGSQAGMGGNSPQGLDKLADLYKDVWGHLPETLRQEMDAYQKEGYMAKYRELLKQYYATVAEKGRRPAEGDR